MTRRSRGTGLLEVLVALPLIALLGVVAVQLLLGVHRQVLRVDGALGATRELRHGAGVLAAELRVLRARDVVAFSDTAVEFDGTVGIGFACAGDEGATQLSLLSADTRPSDTDPLATVWNQPPQAGDQVTLWLAGATPSDTLRAAMHTVRAVSADANCGASPLPWSGSTSTVQVTLAEVLAGSLAIGTPVRFTRRTRYSLYRASDGDWFLGRRTRGASGWDVTQPVAGPLCSARNRGLVIRLYDQRGALVDRASVRLTTRLSVELRAPRQAGRASPAIVQIDSARIDVALRAEREREP